ncbi:MAG TPA: hypothetical protein DD400_01255, partial [Rhodospirillaceae bacterium]|nr:hypothetical protein [Rhodospirillaceae bacterium]
LGPKGTVLVNGHAVIDPSGKKYTVIPKREGMINLYAGTLPKNTYLVLGNAGTIDSSRFGLISCEEIIGIVKR